MNKGERNHVPAGALLLLVVLVVLVVVCGIGAALAWTNT